VNGPLCPLMTQSGRFGTEPELALNFVHVAEATGKRAHHGNGEIRSLVHEEEEGLLGD
jgi:hypothetical protein